MEREEELRMLSRGQVESQNEFDTGQHIFTDGKWVTSAASVKQCVSQNRKQSFTFGELPRSFSNLLKALSEAHVSPHIVHPKFHSQSFRNLLKAFV